MIYINEEALISDLLANNESAFQHVVKMNSDSMMYVARSIVGNSIAEEIVQDAWISIIKGLPKFEGRSSFKSWSLKIVRNSAITRLHREKRNVAVGDVNDLQKLEISSNAQFRYGSWLTQASLCDIDSPDALLIRDELKDILYHAFEKLSLTQQNLISMRDLEGIAMDKICDILGLSETNSRVQLHRARRKIRKIIREYQACHPDET